MKNIYRISFFILFWLYNSAWAGSPSFDCSKATIQVEHVICESDDISRLDVKLSKLYKNIIDNSSSSAKNDIKSAQIQWLNNRNQGCDLKDAEAESCLEASYKERISTLSVSLAFDSSTITSDDELTILRITPKGENVLAGQQIVFQFDRPVVPIGRMERQSVDIPVSIKPELNCEWRWLNTSALACQLREEDKMKRATHYEVVMSPGIQAESGSLLHKDVVHSFTTRRPKVTYTRFLHWLSPGEPLIQVTFNQPVTKSSVESTMTMSASSADSYSIVAYPDEETREISPWTALVSEDGPPKVNDQLTNVSGEDARKVWIVQSEKKLPIDKQIDLNIDSGLISSEGPVKGIEKRTVVSFDTYPEFKFVGIRCTLEGDGSLEDIPLEKLGLQDDSWFASIVSKATEMAGIEDAKKNSKLKKCAPLSSVALLFSSPVVNSMVKKHVRFSPALDGDRKDYDPWKNTHDTTSLTSPHRNGYNYRLWLPEYLQANKKYSVSIDSDSLQDEFGRKLNNNIKFSFLTAHRDPKLKLTHNYAVLEKGVESEVPIYVTNLDSITVEYDKLGSKTSRTKQLKGIKVDKVEDVAFAMPLGVRKLIGDDSGVMFGNLRPNPKPPIWYRNPNLFAQVTPYQVHFKLGHFNSQAWVTSFKTGEVIEGAKVTLYKGSYEDITGLINLDVTAVTDVSGIANLPGLEVLDPDLKFTNSGRSAKYPGYFVKIEHGSDIALLPLNSNFSVTGGGAYSWLKKKGGHTRTWGTTAQGIYKLGDTIQFKIYVRDQSNKHWISPKKESYELEVTDPQNKVIYRENNITLNEFGSFDGEFEISEQSAIGWYEFELKPEKSSGEEYSRFSWKPMSVLVSDFTPAAFKVSADINGDVFKANDQVKISAKASLHSGGPYTNAEVRLTAKLIQKNIRVDNPIASDFTFDSYSGKSLNKGQGNLLDIRGKLDSVGQYRDTFTLPETDIYYGTVIIESAVKDERGKFIASTVKADYAGRNNFVGLRNTKWLYQKGKAASFEALVVNQHGDLVPGIDISIKINHREYKASRVKGPGNAYLTKNIMEWVEETECALKSKASASICTFKPQRPGYYQFVAKIKDDNEKVHKTTLTAWVTGRGSVVWDQSNDATLQIIPEQTNYNIGDTARYLVKNPFPGAKALITVERYGILDSWVETLDTSTPVIEVPIKADYLPGFYLSIVAISPRVEKPIGPNKVDLGKPSYRMGYVTAKISDPYKKIELNISTDKEIYKPRDIVNAKIKVSHKAGASEPVEIVVVVVDESVLALNKSGDNYYDPYTGFNHLDTLDVKNYSLISRLVGRQKFDKKGANPGGDGMEYPELRNLFKFVSYWNPSITPDESGQANIKFEVPDNLTGWRIFAFAVTPDDHMGLGDTNIKVNRPTEIRPIMPNQVIEGDEFKAGFNVMNRTGHIRKLTINVDVTGPLLDDSEKSFVFNIALDPYDRTNVWLPLHTKGSGVLSFTARGGDNIDADSVEHSVPVNKRRSLETAATYGSTISESVSESIKVPDGIYTDVGSIGAILSPSVIGNVDGAFKYIKDYPHTCWEQQLTKAVVANSYVELKEYLSKSTKWATPKKDIEKTLSVISNFQAPNGGMVYWTPTNKHVSPYLSAYTALALNWLRGSGYEIPELAEESLHIYLTKLLRKDEFPSFYSKGMSTSVRAIALAALAGSGETSKQDIARYEPFLEEMDLFGKSHFLQAATKTNDVPKATINKILDSILAHASQTGGKIQFNEAWDDSYKYILATPLRSNCSILSSLVSTQINTDMGKVIRDTPTSLVRSITQSRGNRDHWENTQENVFCLNALIDYSSVYETEKPSMEIEVSFDDELIGEASFSSKSDAPVKISRPMGDGDPGLAATLEIEKSGEGRIYYSAQIAYDLKEDNASRINSGIEIHREYSIEKNGEFVILESPMDIKRGELVKVDLFISVPTARHFVSVYDPIPGGLEPVNSDLATTSQFDADKGTYKAAEGSWFYNFSNWSYYGRYFWSFYHKELRHDSARFYADYLPSGNYHLSYTAQAIAEGKFSVMPAHAEEMYDPDVYGKSLPSTLIVSE